MVWLVLLAFAASTLGAISGLGGGVFLMPLLVTLMSEDWSPASLATLSISIVLLNSMTTLFLGKQFRNADLSFAKRMAIVASAGALLGIWLQSQVSRVAFEIYLSIFLFFLSLFIFWRASHADRDVPAKPKPFNSTDSLFGVVIGAIASLFGLGGGVLQVPYMVMFRKRSVKQSTATSQIILSTTAAVILMVNLGMRNVPVPWQTFLYLAPVVVCGGILGSKLAQKMRGPWIVRLLGAVLLFLAVRVGLKALQMG